MSIAPWLRIGTALVLLAGGTSLGTYSAIAAWRGSGPALVATPAELFIESAQPGERLTAEVSVRNRSWSLVRIHALDATCGCTAPRLSVASLGPGATTMVPIAIEAGRAGSRVKSTIAITYYLEDEGQGPYVLEIPILTKVADTAAKESD